jgi:GNAT superfamily N-acetyltransferase
MSDLRYETVFDPPREVLEPVNRGLHEYNLLQLGPQVINRYAGVVIIVKDEQGHVAGGIIGEMFWDWLHIDTLWVAPERRGSDIGTRLPTMAEDPARAKGFYHAHLETTDFQALAFSRKNGYEVFGTLEGKPAGHTWYYLKKDLAEP